MADKKSEPGLPGPQVLENFGTEIRSAMAAGIVTGIAAGTADLRKLFPRWAIAAIVLGMITGGAAGWLSATWARTSATEWSVHHAGPIETCTLVPGGPSDRPAFICRLGDPPPENVPQSALYRTYDR